MIAIGSSFFDYKLVDYEHEYLDDCAIVFLPELDIIISLNITATFIWEHLRAAIQDNKTISDLEITNDMIASLELDSDLHEVIRADVAFTIIEFERIGVIFC